MEPLNPNEKMIITRAFPFTDGKAEIWIKETRDPDAIEKCGLINKRGEFVIPPVYDRIGYSGGDTVDLQKFKTGLPTHLFLFRYGKRHKNASLVHIDRLFAFAGDSNQI